MGKKMTDEQKAAAAKKRAALRAEADAKGAEEKANTEAKVKAGANTKTKAAARPETKAKRVSVKTVRGVKSRWRAGHGFGPEPREILLDDLSEDQLEALEADPSLVVSLEG